MCISKNSIKKPWFFSIKHRLLGLRPQTSTGAPPLDPAGGLWSPSPHASALPNRNPGSATAKVIGLSSTNEGVVGQKDCWFKFFFSKCLGSAAK
jgi:hypothetical protein